MRIAELWWRRGRHYEREGRKWTEKRQRQGADGNLEEYDCPMYAPVLDLPAIESALRLDGLAPEDWPATVLCFEAMFVAERARWDPIDLRELEELVSDGK